MVAQLPPEVVGVAAGVLVYSLICLASGIFLLWLVWVHDERKSYVAMLGLLMSLHTLASVIQQIHTIIRWRDIKTEQYANLVANVGDPELNITGGSTGLDLVLFYIQYYAYNVESMLVFFWAVELANSIFQLRIVKMYRFHASLLAKAFATILPAVQMILLRYSGVNRSTIGFMALADAIMIGCFALGMFLLLAILIRYLHSRITLASWNVRYGQATGTPSGTNGTRSGNRPGTAHAPRPPKRTIYDKWLVLRFSVAFAALSLFQIVVINFQLRAASTNTRANVPDHPDLSTDRARGDFALFAPAPSAVLFAFFVFGTTRTFREYMWNLFVPRAWRDKVEERRRRRRGAGGGGSVEVVHSAIRSQTPGGGDVEGGVIGLRELGSAGGRRGMGRVMSGRF
ncbi:hypothetical protein NEMBOFW57_006509 [Staphylotrichum longicolle]|uniref:Uncharacterized protein n=1 Tax=Staphylotrichum longicolle TaxID=669026 RepID=A0AAD4ET10_9PEZI|nr:hypothetical protein NEMBOFW57_006509 [Staphylotrichum longicolle]